MTAATIINLGNLDLDFSTVMAVWTRTHDYFHLIVYIPFLPLVIPKFFLLIVDVKNCNFISYNFPCSHSSFLFLSSSVFIFFGPVVLLQFFPSFRHLSVVRVLLVWYGPRVFSIKPDGNYCILQG
jgi:hypothetical protein